MTIFVCIIAFAIGFVVRAYRLDKLMKEVFRNIWLRIKKVYYRWRVNRTAMKRVERSEIFTLMRDAPATQHRNDMSITVHQDAKKDVENMIKEFGKKGK